MIGIRHPIRRQRHCIRSPTGRSPNARLHFVNAEVHIIRLGNFREMPLASFLAIIERSDGCMCRHPAVHCNCIYAIIYDRHRPFP